MSFSSEVKAELAKHLGKSMHCRIAELAALIAFAGNIQEIQSENPLLQEKYRLLIKQPVHQNGIPCQACRKNDSRYENHFFILL